MDPYANPGVTDEELLARYGLTDKELDQQLLGKAQQNRRKRRTQAEITAHRTSRRSVAHQSRWKNMSEEQKEKILQNLAEGSRRRVEMYKK